jgi:hypothetical protein
MKLAALAIVFATASCGLCVDTVGPKGEVGLSQAACGEPVEVDSAICGRTCGSRGGGEPFRYLHPACTPDADKVLREAMALCKSTGMQGCVNTVCHGCEAFASVERECGRGTAN